MLSGAAEQQHTGNIATQLTQFLRKLPFAQIILKQRDQECIEAHIWQKYALQAQIKNFTTKKTLYIIIMKVYYKNIWHTFFLGKNHNK